MNCKERKAEGKTTGRSAEELSCRAGWWKISEDAAAVTGVRATAGEASVCGRGGGWIEREESRQKGRSDNAKRLE